MQIPLTCGLVAEIDPEDWPLVVPCRLFDALDAPIAGVLKQNLTMHYRLFYDAAPDYAECRTAPPT